MHGLVAASMVRHCSSKRPEARRIPHLQAWCRSYSFSEATSDTIHSLPAAASWEFCWPDHCPCGQKSGWCSLPG